MRRMNRLHDVLIAMQFPSGTNPRMATGRQLRAARAALGWTVAQLSEQSGVSRRTIERYEAAEGVPLQRGTTLATLVSSLEAGGVAFIRSREDHPGILIRGASGCREERS
jgi:transcriptional regulator with XRE-family HTH domain